MIIGIDLDNTIISYDRLMLSIAAELGLTAPGAFSTKRELRDHLRGRGEELKWRLIQGLAYGERIDEADIFPGACEFLGHCREREIPVHIVSHKSIFAAEGPRVDLRAAALACLGKKGVVGDPKTVFFEDTRTEKIQRLVQLGCTVAIDDLPEVFLDPAFPVSIQRYLFVPNQVDLVEGDWTAASSWNQLERSILGGTGSCRS